MKALLFVLLLSSFFSVCFATDAKVNQRQEKPLAAIVLCDKTINFKTSATINEEQISIDSDKSLLLKSAIAKQRFKGKPMASNVSCQQLKGQHYTGSDSEWLSYLQRSIQTLNEKSKSPFELTVLVGDDKVYTGTLNNKEYRFSGVFDGHNQHIYNLALINKNKTVLYTVSVSGSTEVDDKLVEEFNRIVNIFH